MVAQATLSISAVAGVTVDPHTEVPMKSLVDYFRVWDVQLDFIVGAPLPADPTRAEDVANALIEKMRPPGGQTAPAVLVLAGQSPDGPDTNGILLDLESRGVSAVFTASSAYQGGSLDDRFQIYAHEIGHVLNLTHGEADDEFPTAMNQWDDRSTVSSVATVWRKAIDAAVDPGYKSQLRGFFGSGQRQPLGLPMSASCCRGLVRTPLSDVQPWGGTFDDANVAGGTQDAVSSVQCHLRIQNQSLAVGEPLAFDVELRMHRGHGSADVPSSLELHGRQLQIVLTSPDGGVRALEPTALSCGGGSPRRLRADSVARSNFCIATDRRGLLFPVSGHYRISAHLPRLGIRSPSVEVEVHEGRYSPARILLASLSDRKSYPPSLDIKSLQESISDKSLGVEARAHLHWRAASLGMARPELKGEIAEKAPARIREDMALLKIARILAKPRRDARALHEAIDAAESRFHATDHRHASLDYLAYLRRAIYLKRGTEKALR